MGWLDPYLVHPLRQGNQELAHQYQEILLNAEGLTTFSITPEISERAAKLCSQYNLHTPDAIQLATAIQAGASLFITNDTRIPSVPGIELVVLDNLK